MPLALECCSILDGHQNKVWCLAWSPKGNILASCGEDRQIYLWSNEDLKWCSIKIATPHTRTIRCISWSPCGNFLASCSFDGTSCIWNSSKNFELVATLEGHESEVKCIDWSISGLFLSTCSRDKSVWIWEASLETNEFECVAVLHNHTQDVKKVKWHPLEDVLFSISYDNTIKIYASDLDGEWNCIFLLDGHSSTVWGISFDVNGDKVLTCSDDKSLILWKKIPDKYHNYVKINSYQHQNDCPIYDVSWSKSNFIATAGGDNKINVYEESNDELSLVLPLSGAHSQDVNSVSWNPCNNLQMASCSDDGLVKIWKFILS
ncbi:hypothetical protein HELRODRAFT_186550 [Helobdella robusta]|uniref:Probable cytosolic iron-sulfur protein assembly protein CIAO1 homolog n=1 Tax=Helobdella robusta TaxID=6412 RepID=T1FP10_HELRO|nr:hypothetical protein HELRODRAFT_186550 [Helobdella robusta]ESN94421.1 hypothetical protein HELRODRAFT_186550 [Helobdella robusta]